MNCDLKMQADGNRTALVSNEEGLAIFGRAFSPMPSSVFLDA